MPRRIAPILCLAIAVSLISLFAGASRGESPVSGASVRVVGTPQVVFDWSEDACEPMNYPDLPARTFRDFRGRVQLMLSHFENFRMIGPSFDRLRVDCDAVMRSDRSRSVRRYQDREWIGSLFTRDGRTVWALVHDEFQGNRHSGRCPSGRYLSCWYNAITLARSDDGGRSYRQAPPPGHLIAAAPYRYRPDSGPAGVFTPSNVVPGPDGAHYALVRVRDPGGRRGTCLLRTDRVWKPHRWRAWDGDGFDGVFTDPYRSPPRPGAPCRPLDGGRIAEMAESLTYNAVLDRYLLIGLAPGSPSAGPQTVGIYFSTSRDLVTWTPRQLVTRATTKQSYRCGGPSPLAYPSLIDPSSRSRTFATSDGQAFLYYTQFRYRDCRRTADRDLVRVPVEISG